MLSLLIQPESERLPITHCVPSPRRGILLSFLATCLWTKCSLLVHSFFHCTLLSILKASCVRHHETRIRNCCFQGILKVYLGRCNIDRLALINGSPVNYKSFGGVKISQCVLRSLTSKSIKVFFNIYILHVHIYGI